MWVFLYKQVFRVDLIIMRSFATANNQTHPVRYPKIRHFSLYVVEICGQILYTPIVAGKEEKRWTSKKQAGF